MTFSKKKSSNLFLLIGSFVLVSLILWNTNSFFKEFKEEERKKMEIWASAQSELMQSSEIRDLGNLHLTIFQNNTSTPMILVNKDGSSKLNNFPDNLQADSLWIEKRINRYTKENPPISIDYKGTHLATLYYGNSEMLNKLKYYPVALLLIIFLFGAVIFFFFKVNKASEQNKLWAGMAKETAHQLGTPLTSLLGWNELLRAENTNEQITSEIDKDILRLHTIADRFSKIGSLPKLDELDIVAETKSAYDYLKLRSSKLIQFSFHTNLEGVSVLLNRSLFQWTIENLVKNGADAMRGKGSISIEMLEDSNYVNILVTDTGQGITKGNYQRIFNPGFTSKKRGWGLGLSLAKRIIEEYHGGKIKVLSSSKEGTIMKISLRKTA